MRLDCHPKDKDSKKTEQRPREILERVAERWIIVVVYSIYIYNDIYMSLEDNSDIIEVGERVKMRFAISDTDLLHVLDVTPEIEFLINKEYFNKHQNNFHLRLHLQQNRTSRYAEKYSEIATFLATDEGRDIAILSTYQRITGNQRDLFNFFTPLKNGDYSNTDLVGYILEIIQQNIRTLSKAHIFLPESITQKLTRENLTEQINEVAKELDAFLLLEED